MIGRCSLGGGLRNPFLDVFKKAYRPVKQEEKHQKKTNTNHTEHEGQKKGCGVVQGSRERVTTQEDGSDLSEYRILVRSQLKMTVNPQKHLY